MLFFDAFCWYVSTNYIYTAHQAQINAKVKRTVPVFLRYVSITLKSLDPGFTSSKSEFKVLYFKSIGFGLISDLRFFLSLLAVSLRRPCSSKTTTRKTPMMSGPRCRRETHLSTNAMHHELFCEISECDSKTGWKLGRRLSATFMISTMSGPRCCRTTTTRRLMVNSNVGSAWTERFGIPKNDPLIAYSEPAWTYSSKIERYKERVQWRAQNRTSGCTSQFHSQIRNCQQCV